MSDQFDLFGDSTQPAMSRDETSRPMTQSQRGKIREAFSRLEITDARSQFDLIEDLTGKRIARVQDVSFQSANALLPLLEARVLSSGKKTTGNAWADRQEDTWIDKL